MMRFGFTLFFAILVMVGRAQSIEVSGLQSGVWDADTVFVSGDVLVQDSLRIAAKTTVLFTDFYSISIEKDATLTAIGTANDSILFTIADTTGFHIFNSGRGGWNGIRLNKAGRSVFDYCRFQYGKAAMDRDQDGGALRIFDCEDVEISNSTLFCNFSREHGGALSAEWSNVVIHDCNISHNLTYTKLDTVYGMYGGGLRFLNCKVDITGTSFRYNIGQRAIGGALCLDSCNVNIDRCKFEHNYGINGGGLYLIRSNDWMCSITNSLFANNTSEHFGGGLAICDSSPFISNLTVVNNHSIGVNCGGIFIYQLSSPELWNCIVYGNTNKVLLEKPVQMWSWAYEGSGPSFYNCLVQFGFDNITNQETIKIYKNCIDDNPRFANLVAREDFHLGSNSPCINAGSPETPVGVLNGTDLDGIIRVCGNRIDIGAYEYTSYGINEIVKEKQDLRIVGNPITENSFAEVELEQDGILKLSIVSTDGKLLLDKNLGHCPAGINHIELGSLFQNKAKGFYHIIIQNQTQRFIGKVIR